MSLSTHYVGCITMGSVQERGNQYILFINPDKTEFILFGSKKQTERLNACFPIDILGNPSSPHRVCEEPGCVV